MKQGGSSLIWLLEPSSNARTLRLVFVWLLYPLFDVVVAAARSSMLIVGLACPSIVC